MHTQPPLLVLPSSYDRVRGMYWRYNEEFLGQLVALLRGKRVLEVFSGNGLMAGVLSSHGVDVLATSLLSESIDSHEAGLYHPVEHLDAVEAVERHARECDVLLMIWPTTTRQAADSADLWRELNGGPVVYIGETTDYSRHQYGGCATDDFFARFRVLQELDGYRGNMYERAWVGELTPATPAPARAVRP